MGYVVLSIYSSDSFGSLDDHLYTQNQNAVIYIEDYLMAWLRQDAYKLTVFFANVPLYSGLKVINTNYEGELPWAPLLVKMTEKGF